MSNNDHYDNLENHDNHEDPENRMCIANPDNTGIPDNPGKEIEQDFFSLLKVPMVRRHLQVQVDQVKEIYREQIKSYFLENPSKVIPFPGEHSSEFKFELKRIAHDGGSYKWKVFLDSDKYLPLETILPYPIIDLISGYPIDTENTKELLKIVINGYTYNIYFIKALSDYIVGIVQRIENQLRVAPDNFLVFDTTQYTDLPETEKVEILKWFLDNQPALRKKMLFEFFVHILPDSGELQNIV